ncbi:uncharacterized protein LOC100571358 [Acyrthosiphon pisum]|uniref:Uncharacterized protein n=1 Tax=Acyrthosiphon pisum TaxID=7029 RepID=A0A8R2A8K2_ACYPI|nr:uncharacterized protein LOC100571358 [Acyrthosiphon pisum]|eukprot:XP_003244269.1 PREDICTED: uncharacterized protein LOC100571358 [Acyrthosiphon pisum]
MDRLIFNLYQYFFGKNQQNFESEDHSKDYLNNIMKEEESNSISTSTNSKHSIEFHPSRDETDAFSLHIEDKSKLPNTTPIEDQIPQCTELYQCLKNTVKELGEQKLILDTQFKGLTLNLNNNNIRLIAVENEVKNIILKYMSLSQMYETLQDQLEMVSGKINVKFDDLEQMFSYHSAECYRTNDIPEDL